MADRKELKRKSLYVNLMETGEYFPGVKTTLFPNGEAGEIWISDGINSVCIKASKGRAGLGLTISRHAGTAPLTVTGNLSGDYDPIPQMDAAEVSICQYRTDTRSQAFKRWYGLHEHVETDDERVAYDNGRACARQEKDPEQWTKPADERVLRVWWSGYYAQIAGLHDKE